jgi:predicted ATP-grasp superfamily ATP-dependent carboligase
MQNARDRVLKIYSIVWKALFLGAEILRSRLGAKRKLRILFSSEKDLEPTIRRSFRYTKHEIAFADISAEAIKHHDLVVPMTIPALKYLADLQDPGFQNLMPLPSLEAILLCDDKYLLNQRLTANGFGAFVPRMGNRQSYPYILKKRIDAWGANTHIISDPEQEKTFLDKIADPDYFKQQLITGPFEYATHVVFNDGRIFCSLNVEYKFANERPIKGKDLPVYSKLCQCPYLDLFSEVLSCIGFNGLCCINYKVYGDIPFILEINPRFGLSLSPYFFAFIRQLDASPKPRIISHPSKKGVNAPPFRKNDPPPFQA